MIKARLFSFEDIPYRVKWINDIRINKSMFFDLPATIEKTEVWYRNKDKNTRIDFSFINQSEMLIGMGGFTNIDKNNLNAEFYIMVSPLLQGKGYGKSLSLWMFNFAFIELNLHKIYLYTNDNNIAAYKIYEYAGFKLEGTLREQKYKKGKFISRRFYGLLRQEWLTKDWKKEKIEYEF